MTRNTLTILICFSVFNSLYAKDTSYQDTSYQNTLTFARAAEMAIANSADLRYSRSSQALSEGAWKWGRLVYFPKLSVSVSENDRLQQFGQDSFLKNYGVNIDQFVFDGGRTRMSRGIERMELELSSSRLDRMAADILESAVAVYRGVLSSRAILEIKKTALVLLEEQRRILSEEVKLGLALKVDLVSADINLADARLGIFSLELELSEMEKQFAELLGLETLPELTEKVDINRAITLPQAAAAAALAKEKNPDLAEARFAIARRQAEVKYYSNLWIPTVRLAGSVGLTGQRYPLTRFNWSVGVNIDFSSPWFQNRVSAQAGWEPFSKGEYDKTAIAQNSLTPLPDPASAAGKKQAKLALTLEQENYSVIFERIGRTAISAVEKCALAERRRTLALEAIAIGGERLRVEEIRLGLGQITRLKLMEAFVEQTQREITAVETATALLEAERELERLLDLRPGELAKFASGVLALNPAN